MELKSTMSKVERESTGGTEGEYNMSCSWALVQTQSPETLSNVTVQWRCDADVKEAQTLPITLDNDQT